MKPKDAAVVPGSVEKAQPWEEEEEEEKLQTPFNIVKRKRAEKGRSGRKKFQLVGKRPTNRKPLKQCCINGEEELVPKKERVRRVRTESEGIEAS